MQLNIQIQLPASLKLYSTSKVQTEHDKRNIKKKQNVGTYASIFFVSCLTFKENIELR